TVCGRIIHFYRTGIAGAVVPADREELSTKLSHPEGSTFCGHGCSFHPRISLGVVHKDTRHRLPDREERFRKAADDIEASPSGHSPGVVETNRQWRFGCPSVGGRVILLYRIAHG